MTASCSRPHIRHRVLESSPGLEVVELTTPDVHATYVDHELALPTVAERPERDFGGQRFLHDRAAGASWRPLPWPGFEARATGVEVATGGLAGARVVRAVVDGATSPLGRHGGELRFWFVLEGAAVLRIDGRPDRPLVADDAAGRARRCGPRAGRVLWRLPAVGGVAARRLDVSRG